MSSNKQVAVAGWLTYDAGKQNNDLGGVPAWFCSKVRLVQLCSWKQLRGFSASPAGRRPGTCRTLELDSYSLEKFLFSELYSKATRWRHRLTFLCLGIIFPSPRPPPVGDRTQGFWNVRQKCTIYFQFLFFQLF